MNADRRSRHHSRSARDEREDMDFERRSSGWVGVKDRLKTRSLYRDKENGILLGICAGIALYFGVERFVVRLIVIAGLFFGLAGVIIPAYIVLYFILEDVSKAEGSDEQRAKQQRRFEEESEAREEKLRRSSVKREIGGQPPRVALRSVRATIRSLEIRMRRIEKFVTSSNYELNKELHNL